MSYLFEKGIHIMTRAPKDASERNFQENFVKELTQYQWKAPEYLNGNKQRVTVADLVANWRNELNRINADQLEGIPLTDKEFEQVMMKVGQISNSYEAAKILSIEEGKGKIDGIYRDPNPKLTRKQITLTIFKKAEVRGGDSSYQIAREIETPNGNRFDLVLLINGLPLINIEQKRTDKSVDEAFGQFKRYYRDGEYTHNFMAFSQMMVISTEMETRYFATPKSLGEFNPSFVFHWSDQKNKQITHWQEVIKHFLMIPMAHQMVGDYLVIDEATQEENRRHMLMRPYQVYALQAVEMAAFGLDNPDKIPHGGYVWHTTGSGKTITSFKTALFLSTRLNFEKVVFLVDRKELDSKTSENFKAYAAYEPVVVDDNKYTAQLRKQLESAKTGIIVTTIFKLNGLVQELEKNQNTQLSDKKMVFIVDEAHRSTMKDMMGTIQRYFKKNSLFYGFTGTPLFDENKAKGMVNEKSEVINTTEKLFGPKLHEYTIDQAISDGNVLGFHVDYMNTGEFQSYEQLREDLAEAVKLEKPNLSDRQVERLLAEWSELEVEEGAKKRNLIIYQDETHMPRVVAEILENWEAQSRNGQFNAIFTVAYKKRVIAYYKEFKKQMAEKDMHINIAMTFSTGNENDPDTIEPEIAEGMFKDYAEFTGIHFHAGDTQRGEAAYFEDVVDRATRGGSGRNAKNIDLIIVADRLLTGYDSKRLNTLYVDRSLELQGLIQAYSRTNRIFGSEKEFGTIVNFQYPRIAEATVNRALELYGSGGSSSLAIVDHYEVAVEKLKIKVQAMMDTLADPTDWQSLQNHPEEEEAFISAYKEVADQLNKVKQYYEFEWSDSDFGIDETEWMRYQGGYRNLKTEAGELEPPMPIQPLVGKTKLAGTQVIDAAHILSLIGSKISQSDGYFNVDTETLRIIHEQIEELSNLGEHKQSLLLKDFVDGELAKGTLSSAVNFDDAFDNWKKSRQRAEIQTFAQQKGLDPDLLEKSISAYSFKTQGVPYMTEITQKADFEKATHTKANNQLTYIIELTGELEGWIKETKVKYE